jgi:hypothetical protein
MGAFEPFVVIVFKQNERDDDFIVVWDHLFVDWPSAAAAMWRIIRENNARNRLDCPEARSVAHLYSIRALRPM